MLTVLDRLKNDYWVTRDNRVLEVKDMDDNHLINTIAMLIREAIALKDEADMQLALIAPPTSDGAEMAFFHEQDKLWDTIALEWLREQPAYIALVTEATRRGLSNVYV